MKRAGFIGFLIVVGLYIISCSDNNGCGVNITNDRLLKVSFGVKYNKVNKDTSILVYVAGIGAITPTYTPDSSGETGIASLPLSQNSDSCKFVFIIDSTYYDTLLFIYDRQLEMISDNCFNTVFSFKEFQNVHSGDTLSDIDTAYVLSTRIDSDVKSNIRFYLKHRSSNDTTTTTK